MRPGMNIAPSGASAPFGVTFHIHSFVLGATIRSMSNAWTMRKKATIPSARAAAATSFAHASLSLASAFLLHGYFWSALTAICCTASAAARMPLGRPAYSAATSIMLRGL